MPNYSLQIIQLDINLLG